MFGTLRGFEVSLFDEFRRLQWEAEDAFAGDAPHSFARGAFPAVDVVSDPQQVDVFLTAPGIDAKALNISIQQNVLSVTGRREAQVDGKGSVHALERFTGEFRRVISLPEDVDPSRVSASYVDGVVRISVQRREAAKPRQIEIH
jgi:HSP20 family protein